MPVKTALFLVGGLIENHQGTSRLDRSGGLATKRPIIAVLFAIPALSLAGLPPFSGFVAKLGVISAGIEADQYVVVIVALVAGALTGYHTAPILSDYRKVECDINRTPGGGWAGGRGLRGLRWRGHASAGGLWCVVVALVWWPYWQASAICGSVVCPIRGRGVRGACAGCGPCRGVHVVMGVRCCAPQWAWRVAAGAILEGVSYLELLGGVACSGAGAVGWRAWQA